MKEQTKADISNIYKLDGRVPVGKAKKVCGVEIIPQAIEDAKENAARNVYVSCDSATLARDAKYLCENGYELKKVRIFDNFSQGVHVETVCLLSKKCPVQAGSRAALRKHINA